MKPISIQSGLSLIATILALLLFSLFIAVAVSLVTTGANIGVQETQGQQAFYIAEGGIHYAIKKRVFPNYSTAGSTVTLGRGTFEILTPAYLTAAATVAATTITVNSTTGFPASGKILIDSEVMTYTSKTGTTFTLSSGAAQPHVINNSAYPVTVLNGALDSSSTTITVNDTTGFLIPGMITTDSELTMPSGSPVRTASEHIYCAGKTSTTFTGCTRGYNGTPADVHSSGTNVFQYVFRSKGVITSNPMANPTQRIVSANMTPRTRKSAIGWTWPPSKEWTLGAFAIKPAGGDSIAYDFSAYATFSKTATPPYQWSHTVIASGTFLYVGLAFAQVSSNALNYATTVTYAGYPLTLLGRQSHPTGQVSVEIWYWDSTMPGNPVTPPPGTNNIVVTVGIPKSGGYQFGLIGGSASFTGTTQDPIIDASANFAHGTGTYASVNVTITTPNAWILDALSQLKTPNAAPISPQIAYPNWGLNQQQTQVEGALGAGSYVNSKSLFPGTANNMKVTISEQY